MKKGDISYVSAAYCDQSLLIRGYLLEWTALFLTFWAEML